MKWKVAASANYKAEFRIQVQFHAGRLLRLVVLSYKHIDLDNVQPCRLLLMHKHSGNVVTADIAQVTHAIKRQKSTTDLARADLPWAAGSGLHLTSLPSRRSVAWRERTVLHGTPRWTDVPARSLSLSAVELFLISDPLLML